MFIGAWAALLAVSGLAVLAGRVLLRYMRLSVLHYIGAACCLLLAVVTLVGDRPRLTPRSGRAGSTLSAYDEPGPATAPTARSAGCGR